jgi:hypothetical protein
MCGERRTALALNVPVDGTPPTAERSTSPASRGGRPTLQRTRFGARLSDGPSAHRSAQSESLLSTCYRDRTRVVTSHVTKTIGAPMRT